MIKKILLGLIIIITFFGGALYWVDSKIDKNEISKLIVKKIESSLVGTKAEIAEIKYNLGLNLNFEIVRLSILDAESKNILIALEEATIDMNLFSILFGSGKIDINVDSPQLNLFKESDGKINLKKYISTTGNKESKDKPKLEQKSKNSKVEIPNFIENSSLNFKLTNLIVNYKDIKTSNFKVDRIIVKDLGFKKSTAYEFVSSINYKLDEVNDIQFKIFLFGELSLKEIISNQSFSLNSFLYIKDINSSLLKSKLDDIETKIDFSLDEKSNIKALVNSKSREFIDLNISIKSKEERLFFDIKKLDIKLAKIVELLDINNLNTNKSLLSTSGKIDTNFSLSNLVPELHMKLSGPISINLINQSDKINSFSIDLVNETATVNSTGKVINGDFTVSSSTKINLLKLPNTIESLNKISSKISFNNGVIPKEWLKASADKKDELEPKKVKLKSNQGKASSLILPITETHVDVRNLNIGESSASSRGKIKTFSNKIQSDDFSLGLDDSKTKTSFNISFKRIIETNFNLVSQSLNLKSFKAFLPKNLEELTGILDIKSSGSISLSNQVDYNVSGVVNARDGSLRGLNLRDTILSFVGKLSKFVPKKDLKVSEEYEVLNLSFMAKPSNVIVNNLKIVGKNKSIDLELKGNIGAESKQSELVGLLLVRDLVSDVKKFSTDGKLPLLLKGEGYFIRPSTSYTTKRLVKNKANNEIKKVKSKLKAKAKDFFKGLNL